MLWLRCSHTEFRCTVPFLSNNLLKDITLVENSNWQISNVCYYTIRNDIIIYMAQYLQFLQLLYAGIIQFSSSKSKCFLIAIPNWNIFALSCSFRLSIHDCSFFCSFAFLFSSKSSSGLITSVNLWVLSYSRNYYIWLHVTLLVGLSIYQSVGLMAGQSVHRSVSQSVFVSLIVFVLFDTFSQ